jgi:pimeloyl-ACP methyl ester carboxylesterase
MLRNRTSPNHLKTVADLFIILQVCITFGSVGCARPPTPAKEKTVVTPLNVQTKSEIEELKSKGIPLGPADIVNTLKKQVSQVRQSRSEKCANFKASLPGDWFQSTAQLPEDPSQPLGRKIEVFYYGKLNAGTVPVVFFNGGPGSDSHGSYKSLTSKQQNRFDSKKLISWVFIDQRGTGCSSAYPEVKSKEDLQQPSAELLARFSHYGSSEIVADAEAIRKSLIGNQPWVVFGQSYGGHIVHRYLLAAPKSVKSAFSHGYAVNDDGYDRTFNRIASQARIYQNYIKQFPEDAARLKILKNELKSNLCFVNQYDTTEEFCGHEILESLAGEFLGFATDHYHLHEWIGAMTDDQSMDRAGLELFLKAFLFSPGTSEPTEDNLIERRSAQLMSKVLRLTDRNIAPMDGKTCHQIKNDLKSKNIFLDDAPLHECAGSLQLYDEQPSSQKNTHNKTKNPFSELTPDFLTVDRIKNALMLNPDLQLHLYSGEWDAFVPVENFKAEVQLLKSLQNFKYIHFNGTGHEGFISESKVWRDLVKAIQ